MYNETPLNTDFYELTMAAGYFQEHHDAWGSFDLFVRRLPANRNFLVVAGIRQALNYLQELRFTDEEIDYLRKQPAFQHLDAGFFEYLREFKFTGTVYAMEEGTIAFPNESIMQVHAPIIEAQLVETFLIATVQFQSMVASKAARVVQAAQSDGKERAVLEFGSRRSHGGEASALAGRAAYIGGCKATSNTLAGFYYGIPVSGTMAHSWIMSYEDEKAAFEAFYRQFKDQSVFLVDTYDSLQGTRIAAELSKSFKGIRLDSGDLYYLSQETRKILDDYGHMDAQVITSGDLNEYRIQDLVAAGSPIDGFGVGTQLSTSADAPYLPMVYKLSSYGQGADKRQTIKLSSHKKTLPGLKQVYRFYDQHGKMSNDRIQFLSEDADSDGVPLIHTYIQQGQLVKEPMDIHHARSALLRDLAALPDTHKQLKQAPRYSVQVSNEMERITEELEEALLQKQAQTQQSAN